MQRQGLGSIHSSTGQEPPLLPGFNQRVGCFCGPDGICVGEHGTLGRTTRAHFPPQPGSKHCLALALPPSMAVPWPRCPEGCPQPATLVSPPRPPSLIATWPVFPGFYRAFTACFYDI